MKALKIFETQSFKRDNNPRKKLGLGEYREIKSGDKIKILTTLYALYGKEWTDDINKKIAGHIILTKGTIISVYAFDLYIGETIFLFQDENSYGGFYLKFFKEHPEYFVVVP